MSPQIIDRPPWLRASEVDAACRDSEVTAAACNARHALTELCSKIQRLERHPTGVAWRAAHAEGREAVRAEMVEVRLELHEALQRALKAEEQRKREVAHWDSMLCTAEARARVAEAEGFKRGWDAHAAQTVAPAAPWLDAVRSCPGDIAQACADVYQAAYCEERQAGNWAAGGQDPEGARVRAEVAVASFRESLEAKL